MTRNFRNLTRTLSFSLYNALRLNSYMQISLRHGYRLCFVVPSLHLRPHLGDPLPTKGDQHSHSVNEARVLRIRPCNCNPGPRNDDQYSSVVARGPHVTRDLSPVTLPHQIPQISTAVRSEYKGGRTLVLYL